MATSNNTTSTVSNALPDAFFSRQLIDGMLELLPYNKYGQSRPLSKRNGKTITFMKYGDATADTTPLTEGVVPDGLALSVSRVSATINQYGKWYNISDLLEDTAITDVKVGATKRLINLAANVIDKVNIAEIKNATNVIYAANSGTVPSDVTAITAAHKLTSLEVRKAVRLLRKNKAVPWTINGKQYFKAIVAPDAIFDLQDDTHWEKVAETQQADKFESGVLGRMYGVEFISATNPVLWEGAGASSADVYGTPVFGQNAYGIIALGGDENAKIISKARGSSGTSDPLDQWATVGYKIMGYAVKIINNAQLVMIKHGVSA